MTRTTGFWVAGILAAGLLLGAAPAVATTVTGTTVVNPGGSIAVGNPPLTFSVTDLTSGVQGINGADFTSGTHYFDYIFSFTLTGPANVSIASNTPADTTVLESHSIFYNADPSGTLLAVQPDINNLIDLDDFSGVMDSGSSTGPDNLRTLANLASGTYFLRLFGVMEGDDISGFLTAAGGTFTISAVAATPIPAALPLFASALGLLGFIHRRRKAPAVA